MIDEKFGKKPEVAEANTACLNAGYHYGETVEAINTQFHVPKRQAATRQVPQHRSATQRSRTA
ncbi:MAG: hypothetical protein QM820_39630 [Minicystis sp.]